MAQYRCVNRRGTASSSATAGYTMLQAPRPRPWALCCRNPFKLTWVPLVVGMQLAPQISKAEANQAKIGRALYRVRPLLPAGCSNRRGNKARMALWDDILLQYIREAPQIEQQVNKHRLTTNLRHGGLGLRQLWWSYITRWITLGQEELQNSSPTQQLKATQYRYIDAVRALGGTVGQHISPPRQHRP